jgi:predicted NAD/FAD-binding protein
MSVWSGRKQRVAVFRSWLSSKRAMPRSVYHEADFHHLLVTPDNLAMRRQLDSLQGKDGIWCVGMYAGSIDNNEGALDSTLPVAEALDPHSPNLARLYGELNRARGKAMVHSVRPAPS